MDDSKKFRAFISYSHQDKQWADWLHKSLEHYRIPKRLIGTQGRDGVIPTKLFPIFRDREELPSSSDLGSQISQALRDSAYLVVICSPRSAKSHWVNEEILSYKRMGNENRILALIVDGEPNVADKLDANEELECFPQALRYKLGDDGELSDEPAEPIAADAREHADGKENAKLKLIAGLLGVGFDDLKQRELEAAKQRLLVTRIIAGSMGLLAVAALISAFYAYDQRGFALEQRDAAVASEKRVTKQAAKIQLKASYATPRFEQEYARLALTLKLDPENSNAGFQALSRLLVNWTPLATAGPQLGASVHSLEFNPDGGTFVSAVQNQSQIWHATTGATVGAPMEHSGLVYTVLVSIDGKRIVTNSGQGTVRISDSVTGEVIKEWRAHEKHIRSIALSRDGSTIATGSKDKTARIWDMEGNALGTPLQFSKTVQRVALSPDGRYLAVGVNGKVSHWRNSDNQPLFTPRECGEHAVVNVMRYSDDGQYIAAGCTTGASVWKAATGELMGPHRAHTAPVYELAISPDRTRLLTGSIDNTAQLWDIATGERIGKTMKHSSAVTAIDFNPNGQYIVTGTSSGSVHIWLAKWGEGVPVGSPLWHHGSITEVKFSPDGVRLLVGTQRGQVKLWDTLPPTKSTLELKHDGIVWAVELSPDGEVLWSGGATGVVRAWNTVSGEALGLDLNHGDVVLSLAASADGLWLVSGGAPHSARLWNAQSGELLPYSLEHTGLIDQVSISTDSSLIAARGRGSKDLMLWDITSGELRHKVAAAAALTHFSFNTAGNRILLSLKNGDAKVFDVETGQFLPFTITLPALKAGGIQGELNSAAFSPDDTLIVTGISTQRVQGSVRLWDANTGAARSAELAHETSVKHVSFSDNGKHFMTVTQDGKAQVWNTATTKRTGDVISRKDTISQAVFDRESSRVITLSLGGKLLLWDIFTNTPLGRNYKQSDFTNPPKISLDGRLIATGGLDNVVRVTHLPKVASHEAPLLAELLEVYSGLTVNESDALVPIQNTAERIKQLRAHANQVDPATASDVDLAVQRFLIRQEVQ